jgi:hypothetical protein
MARFGHVGRLTVPTRSVLVENGSDRAPTSGNDADSCLGQRIRGVGADPPGQHHRDPVIDEDPSGLDAGSGPELPTRVVQNLDGRSTIVHHDEARAPAEALVERRVESGSGGCESDLHGASLISGRETERLGDDLGDRSAHGRRSAVTGPYCNCSANPHPMGGALLSCFQDHTCV